MRKSNVLEITKKSTIVECGREKSCLRYSVSNC